MHERLYFTYIVASRSRTLYTGITNELRLRVFQHKQKTHPGFAARYNCTRLIWFEAFSEVSAAIQREKEIKGWTRAKKIALIQVKNSTWEDLSEPWYPHTSRHQMPTLSS